MTKKPIEPNRCGDTADMFPAHPGGVRRTDPSTSAEAAELLTSAAQIEAEIAACLRDHFKSVGATAEEIADHIGRDKQSVTPRFVELERNKICVRMDKGVVYDRRTGSRQLFHRRKNRSGRSAVVWWHIDHFPKERLP